jgi:hypothetical protein
MKTSRSLLVLPLVAGLFVALPAFGAPARQKARPNAGAVKQQLRPKHKKHHHGLSGRVVHVHHSKVNPGHGSMKVLVSHRVNVKKAAGRAAVNVGVRRRSHTVKVHFHPATRFQVVGKGVVAKPQTRSVSRGKAKGKVVTGVKAQVKTLHIPTGSGSVHRGQWVHVRFPNLVAKVHHHASHVNIHVHKSLSMPAKGKAKAGAPAKKAQ